MNPYRLLLISDRPPRSLWNLVGRIQKELPAAQIAGIVLQTSARGGAQNGVGRRGIADLLLSVVHASAPRSGSSVFGVNELAQECQSRQWPLLTSDNLASQEIASFVHGQAADLALVLGTPKVDPAILETPRYGSLRLEISRAAISFGNGASAAGVSSVHQQKPSVSVEPAFDATPAERVISVRLPPQPFNTPAAKEIVDDLIANDLLFRAVSSLSCGQTNDAAEQMSSWIHEMFTPCFGEDSLEVQADWQKPSKWRTRPTWKLTLHTLLLFSPYVIARNWYRRWTGTFPVVFLFHHLISDRPHRMGIPTAIFLREVEFLQKHYRVVSLSDAMKILRSGSCKEPTVVLTFDDGYADNFLYLRAVTEATRVPASLFVCTDAVDSRQDFQHDRTNGGAGFRALGWDQIRYWQSDRIEFGSHTRSHFNCGSADSTALEEEIVGSREDMKRRLGESPLFFAFPYGQEANMSGEALRVASSSYQCSFSTVPLECFPERDGIFKLVGRKPIPSDVWEIELTVQSIFDLARSFRRIQAKP